MKKLPNRIILWLIVGSILLCASACQRTGLLTMGAFQKICLSAPEGSGAVRELTLYYKNGGRNRTDTLDSVVKIEAEGFDPEGAEQDFFRLDSNSDGYFDVIVKQEYSFSDLAHLNHYDAPLWSTVYEYDLENGFQIASAKYKDYYKTYIEELEAQLSQENVVQTGIDKFEYKGDRALTIKESQRLLAACRLLFAAQGIASGDFAPSKPSNGLYYPDVSEYFSTVSLKTTGR